MKIYILTKEYNAYDQYGEYYVKVFKEFTSPTELAECMGCGVEYVDHMYHGGGRQGSEHVWFNIHEEII